jgi:PAS domain S-box-containing protein
MRAPRVPPDARALGAALVDALLRATDGVFVTDAVGRVVLWNPAAEGILGYSAAETQGRACCATLHGERTHGASPCCDGVGTQTAGRPPVIPAFDMQTVTKAGRAVSINVSVLTVYDRRGGARYMVHLFREVTVRSELSEAYAGNLTRREREVLALMRAGLSTVAMARRLSVSRATIRNHVQNLLQKLGVHSRLEAVSAASGHGPAGAAGPRLARPRRITAAAVTD